MSEKSEAQLRNEEAVRKIMAERGYDRTPVKKKKHNKKLPKILLILPIILVLFLVSAVIIYAVINKNDYYGSKTQEINNYSTEKTEDNENDEDNDNPTDIQIPEEVDSNNDYSNGASNSYYNPAPMSDNAYEHSSEAQPSQQYDDSRTPFDPHHCDAVKAKYDAIYNEINRLQDAWNTAYNNNQLEAAANINKARQEAINNLDAVYWDEVVPCEKEMYGL